MRFDWFAVVAFAALLAGCGAAADENSTPENRWQPPPRKALEALETRFEKQATAAASEAGRDGVADMDLLPSEGGAELLVDRGYINPDEFCEAQEKVMDAEVDPEVEAAFESGWERGASPHLRGMGSTMYNALWAVYCLGP